MNCYGIITKEIITYTLITTHNNDHMPEKASEDGSYWDLTFSLIP